MKHIEIGLLDFGFTEGAGISPAQNLNNLVAYTKLAEQAGFSSIWLSEHHNTASGFFWLNPEVIIPLLAQATQRIRIGTGGLMLSVHQPYRIAYTFKMLSALFAGRIDLGISSGHISSTARELLVPDAGTEEPFEARLNKLLLIFKSEQQLWQQDIIIPPLNAPVPSIWLLGSSYKKLDLVLATGAHFSRSIFHIGASLEPEKEQLNRFRDAYYKMHNRLPKISLAFSGCCHPNRSTAKKLAEGRKRGFVSNNIVGEPGDFIDTIYSFAELFDIDQFTFLNMAIPQKEKLTGIDLLSRELNLAQNVNV